MKKEEKQTIFWAVMSLLVFLAVTWLMTLKIMQLDAPAKVGEAMQVTWIAIAFYAATLILALLRVKSSYYLLAVVIAVYTVGFVGMISTMFLNSDAEILVKLFVSAVAAFGILVNVYWYILAFRLRAALQHDTFQRRINKQKGLRR
ncbi:hypothetical protein [Lentilactobacillus kefiri]|jgi:hypothetical protein|uniref:Uncharacterized protein n=3 Tax=Lentilactobacillus kefiri TaxID=33962 RepID=A0A8E1V2G0_LENKE|nr:hypothetical protein [Lentilactobacillus kefiri]KRL75319.1 hypothetical protein FD08_GL002226 [Lentilactobacillus parakefiri DSM 10551]KRM53725.1 hypothetical protein FC95_GL000671 [Lentilactobacillus kefiri DSM 20587 = JCM 5818]MCJ2161624.1 hypothetical protein [Lentilactobacillus kefiri]MCP9369074.1 hypothetical protein [Lentilactobacillus kefiri]MDH5108371.1 hypothetical protein [Lentilactobacillus kefiri]